MTDCIFCKIVNGEIPAVKVWENEKYLAFLDMTPIKPGHTLLIPKKHDDYLFDLSDEEYSELMLNVKEYATLLKEKLNPKKVGVVVEGFGVPHIHVHLIPLNAVNEIDQRGKKSSKDELNKVAERIKE